ncbi:hypothetical protein C8A01DRAFT_19637 [Parachaetomium inaequale]|uniref:Rhodopsin domain-containing protein n=1 Tax=Parachaetomium inaequale TaxID=2588326 RepID=A0AAN6P7X1_9PEZI|nr:hypothetical protein C8A01DRAFT_19637 [Parachaetomium inaequale]
MANASNPGSADSLIDWLLLNAPSPSSGNSSVLLSVCWSLAGVSAVILALRLYTAARIIQLVRIEDYFMVMAWICGVIHTSLLTAAAYSGLGRHTSSLSPEQVVNAMKFVVICQVFGIASPTFGRISFSIYLLRFVMFERKRRMLLHFCIWSQVVVNVLTAVIIYVQCGRYPSALWDRSIKATCWSPVVQRDFGFFQRSWNSFTDLYLTIMPATIVYNLQISRAKKLGVSLLLGASCL